MCSRILGSLPDTIAVDGSEIKIKNTDFRNALVIVQAVNDPDLSEYEKALIMVDRLIGVENIPAGKGDDVVQQCRIWMDGGVDYSDKPQKPQLIDWEQDEQMIFSAVNKVYGHETRLEKYLHWWSFLGLFYEISDGLFSTVLAIRQKRKKGKKLDKAEREFYLANRDIIDIHPRLSAEEQAEVDALNEIFK